MLLGRVCEVQADLSPQQVAAALWACLRIGASHKQLGGKLASVALRHYTRRALAYRAVDTIGVLWGATQMRRAMSGGHAPRPAGRPVGTPWLSSPACPTHWYTFCD